MEGSHNSSSKTDDVDSVVRNLLQRKISEANGNPSLRLTFPRTLQSLKKSFNEQAVHHRLNRQQFSALMRTFMPSITDGDIASLFTVSDVNPDSTLEFREYVVSIVVAHIMQPTFAVNSTVSSFVDVCVFGFLLFDPAGDGFIVRRNVDQLLNREGDHSNRAVFLSEDRWNELDWDRNGTISFYEFVFALCKWIDDAEIEEEDDEEA